MTRRPLNPNEAGYSSDAAQELYLMMPLDRAQEMDFESIKAVLMTTEPVPLKLYRNPKVYLQSGADSGKELDFRIPASFFERTPEEVKREQEAMTAQVDKMLTLRTREMRERDETLRVNRYKYCLIRVKFPDCYCLEGTFGVHEAFEEVRKFVERHLNEQTKWAPFTLRTPEGKVFAGEEGGKSLSDSSLIPAALLYFNFDAEVASQISKSGQEILYLSPETMQKAENI